MIAYVPASEQLKAPLPSGPDRVVREAFFDCVEAPPHGDFSYVGGEPALKVLRVEANARGWRQVDLRHDADFVVARFSRDSGLQVSR